MGKLIVIDGLDGSGKHTQATLLYEYLKENNINCKLIDFPRYESRTGEIVKEYLHGEIHVGDSYDDKFKTALLYSFDRMYNMCFMRDEKGKSIIDYYNEGYVIVCDRYTSSNYLYMTNDMNSVEYIKFIHRMEKLEYMQMGLPEPNLSIFLELTPEKSIELINRRGNEKDNHENITVLTKAYKALQRIKKFYNDRNVLPRNFKSRHEMQFINCMNEEGELYSIDHITEIVKKLVNDQIIKNI